jgi:hypothetical protein
LIFFWEAIFFENYIFSKANVYFIVCSKITESSVFTGFIILF